MSTERAGSKPERAGSKRRGQPEELSAGGVVVRGQEAIVIVPCRRAADGSRVLGLPKGHIDPGETALEAAIREVREEAGVEVEHISELGEVRYWYTRDGRPVRKGVSFHLFRYASGDVADHDEEVEEVRWLPLEEAASALSYPGEREMVRRATALLEGASDGSSPRQEPARASNERKDR